MKTVGLIGGMSWLTTSHYYTQINKIVNKELGNNHSAKCLIKSYDFAEIENLQNTGKWNEISNKVLESSRNLINCGADIIALCSNTIHIVADEVQEKINIPIINIIDATGEKIKSRNINKLLLLGTKFTMEKNFYIDKLENHYGLNIEVPDANGRNFINGLIFGELSTGLINQKSKNKLVSIINNYDTEGIILACTELPMIIKNADINLPLFDTSQIHIDKIIQTIL